MSYGACNLTKVKYHNDRHIYPTKENYDNKMAYVCGKGYCKDGEVLAVSYIEGAAYTGGSWLSKKKEWGAGHWYAFVCEHGTDDKWVKYYDIKECGSSIPQDIVGHFKDGRGYVRGTELTDAPNIYKDLCYVRYENIQGIQCSYENEGKEYYFNTEDNGFNCGRCSLGKWKFFGCFVGAKSCTSKPADWFGYYEGDYVLYVEQKFPVESEKIDELDMCMLCREEGYILTEDNNCVPESTAQPTTSSSSSGSTTPSTGAGTSVSTASKTVKERCKEYNNNVDCTPERLECYKKGSATTWEDGKCKCRSANEEWEFKNNAGRCVEKQVSVKDISTDTYCGQNNVSKNAGADKTSASGTNWSVVFDYDTMTGKSLCHTSGSGKIAKGTTSSNGNYCWCALQDEADWVFLEQISNNCSGTCAKKCADKVASDQNFRKSVFNCPEEEKEEKPAEQKPVAPEKKDPQVENAKQVLSGFFASASANRNVWKNEEGKFNTARLASDLGAAVVLGTVGGVVSGTVIKKKQIKKGFESLQCYIGGKPMAGWGDTFNVDLAR